MAFALEGCEDLIGEVAGVGVFEEGAVWERLPGVLWPWAGSRRMSIKRELVVSRFPLQRY